MLEKCEVYNLKQKIIGCGLVEFYEKENFVVAQYFCYELFEKVVKDETIIIKIFGDTLIRAHGTAGLVENETMEILELIKIVPINKDGNVIAQSGNKRDDFRIDVEYDAKIFHKKIPTDVSVRDISCSGMSFFCKDEVNDTVIYETAAAIKGTYIITKIQVCRKTKTSEGYVYGCKFIDLLDIEEVALRSWIFTLQAQRRKNKIGGMKTDETS